MYNSLVKLPKYSKGEQTPSDSGSSLVTVDAQLDGKKIKESCGSSSNFEMLFQVAGIVREATQYIKDEKTSKSSPNSYLAVESRLRNLCYALIQAAGPNSLVFCDSIALALRYVTTRSITEQFYEADHLYLASYLNSMHFI